MSSSKLLSARAAGKVLMGLRSQVPTSWRAVAAFIDAAYATVPLLVEQLDLLAEEHAAELAKLREQVENLNMGAITAQGVRQMRFTRAVQALLRRHADGSDAGLVWTPKLGWCVTLSTLQQELDRAAGGEEGMLEQQLRGCVQIFSDVMERKLVDNADKGGWKHDGPWVLLARLREELAELEQAVAHGGDVIGEAADVANFAMMVADVVGPKEGEDGKQAN